MAGDSLAPSQAGATPNRLTRKAPASSAVPTSSTSLRADIEELEREVADLGSRILEHRRDAADRFIDATASRLVALRPPACVEVPSEAQAAAATLHAEAEQKMVEKLKLLNSKAKGNVAAMPKLLEKMDECVARLEKLEQLNLKMDPVFQTKQQ